ncbi:MAG: hypothetical protein JJLCMIEE_02581 [Acidimicrobiales bacterium]|nr:hypothetical protein [Acidimicrobiales bacterium]
MGTPMQWAVAQYTMMVVASAAAFIGGWIGLKDFDPQWLGLLLLTLAIIGTLLGLFAVVAGGTRLVVVAMLILLAPSTVIHPVFGLAPIAASLIAGLKPTRASRARSRA